MTPHIPQFRDFVPQKSEVIARLGSMLQPDPGIRYPAVGIESVFFRGHAKGDVSIKQMHIDEKMSFDRFDLLNFEPGIRGDARHVRNTSTN
jgi:hypothetical protein